MPDLNERAAVVVAAMLANHRLDITPDRVRNGVAYLEEHGQEATLAVVRQRAGLSQAGGASS